MVFIVVYWYIKTKYLLTFVKYNTKRYNTLLELTCQLMSCFIFLTTKSIFADSEFSDVVT